MNTEAGRRLLDWLNSGMSVKAESMENVIAAIEAEARAALLAELEAGVEGLSIDYYGSDMSWDKRGVLRVNTIPARQMIDRAAVLDLIRKAKP